MYDLFNQPSTLPFTGDQLRDIGMQMAADHAEQKIEEWNEKAYELLVRFISYHSQFTCEQFRGWAEGQLPTPPSLRAFGGIINKAAKAGLIRQHGTVKVKNPKAHKANAALWLRNDQS